MSTPPSDLPPPPAPQTPPSSPTQIVGQQAAPSTVVPSGPAGGTAMAVGHTNTLAIVSFVTALVAPLGHFTGVGGITLIVISIVTGHMARSQIRKTGEGGDALALAGLIISYVHLALSAIVFIVFFGFIVAIIAAALGSPH